ncbi:MAG: DNA alkylation repair protein [Bacteroidetes bacterium]|nr:DNA alkylation repair protein [Bacteroidota bacterium]
MKKTLSAGTIEAGDILETLKGMSDPANVKGMARFGINSKNTLGVPVPAVRKLAKEIGRDHRLAAKLWSSGVHEARLLAGFIGDPAMVTENQMEKWARDFDSWDVCDQACSNLFDKTPFAVGKLREWSRREEEFVKRASFVLMASLAVHDKRADDKLFESFLPIIKRESRDERNFVKKAVNWALRQIGKRNPSLNRSAIRAANEILRIDSKAAKWIASDALRELQGFAVARKLSRGHRGRA